ncbi:hypothetical protein [Chryseobacterium indoltheticum]|uniref:hypothetical protein n=1 Tax=Chryseobacterium indoltheticum TaxID=254 RepID=UPI003F4982A3
MFNPRQKKAESEFSHFIVKRFRVFRAPLQSLIQECRLHQIQWDKYLYIEDLMFH